MLSFTYYKNKYSKNKMASKNSPFAYLADSAEETAPQREPKGLTLLQLINKLQDITQDDSSVASYRACYIEGT